MFKKIFVTVTFGFICFTTINADESLSGCTKNKTTTRIKTRRVPYNDTIVTQYRTMCGKHPCTKYKSEVVQKYRQETYRDEEIETFCCVGYIRSGSACTPHCSRPCVNGACTSPEICTCNAGFSNDPNNKYNCDPICSKPCTNVCTPSCINANCSKPGQCVCEKGFLLDKDNVTCRMTDSVCLTKCQNGVCFNGLCVCNPEWEGSFCNQKRLKEFESPDDTKIIFKVPWTIVGGSGGGVMVVFLMCCCICCCRRRRRQPSQRIENVTIYANPVLVVEPTGSSRVENDTRWLHEDSFELTHFSSKSNR